MSRLRQQGCQLPRQVPAESRLTGRQQVHDGVAGWKLMRWGSGVRCHLAHPAAQQRVAISSAPQLLAQARGLAGSTGSPSMQGLIDLPARSPSAGGSSSGSCAGCVRGHSKDVMKRRSRPPTLHLDQACPPVAGQMRVCLARLRGHRHADQPRPRQLLDDLMAQIVPRAHQPVALVPAACQSNRNAAEVRSVKQGHG